MVLLLLVAVPTAAADGISPIGAGLWPTTATGNPGSENCPSSSPAQNGFCIDRGAGEGSIELGVNFSSSKALSIVGVRVYRVDPGNPTGSLWGADGTRLAGPASFSPSSTPGWQDARFRAPVAIAPGQTYVASYFAPTPTYAVAQGFFQDHAFTLGPITAIKSLALGGNGVFSYCSRSCFPTQSYKDSNYWITPLWAYINHCPQFIVGRANITAYRNARPHARGTATNVPCLTLKRIARRLHSAQYSVPKGSVAPAPRWGDSFSVPDAPGSGRSLSGPGVRLWACRLQIRDAAGRSLAARCNSGNARLAWSVVERHGR
jgi:hypothetical protein